MSATKAPLVTRPDVADLVTLDSGFIQEDWSGGSPTDDGDELTGTVLNGTYRVDRILGEGGMGRVYEARHTRIQQKRVAVKVLHREFARDRDALARFQREAEAAASISHPNVVSVLDVDRTPSGMPYMVCEYLQGIDLAEHLKKVGTLELGTAVHIARQLCQGLEAAHRHGVIHRDLKPQNIFLVGDFADGVPARPFVKILDFGLSRIIHADAQLTKTGIIMGTPAFMPPEQALGRKADHRADVYGVGAILYKALTDRAPYDHETPHAAVMAVMKGEPPRLRAVDPKIPVHVELVIERAMAREPAQRYDGMNALALALDQLEPAKPGGAGLAPGQGAPTERAALPLEAMEAHGARSRLVSWLLVMAAALGCTAPVAITGLEHVLAMRLSRLELGLSLGLVLAALFVSSMLVIGSIRRKVWSNTSRVVLAAGHARASLFAALAVLGFGNLSLHLVDDFLVRFVSDPRIVPLGAAWLGWNLVLPVVALLTAGVVLVRRKLLLDAPRTWRRRLAAWLVVVFGLVLSAGIIYGSLLWREQTQTRQAPQTASATAKLDLSP